MPFTSGEITNVKEETGTKVALEAGANAFFSLTLLIKADKLSGLHEWVYKTASSLSDELKMDHLVVFEGLHYAVQPEQSAQSFPEYIHQLSTANPLHLRQKMFDMYARVDYTKWDKDECCLSEPQEIDPESVLGDIKDYFHFLEEHFGPGYMNVEVERAAYNLIIDPPAMQKYIVTHMWRMWEEVMAKEWRRVEPLLQETVEAFRKINLQEISREEAIREVLNYDNELEFEKIIRKLENVQPLIFVPSAHIGPYQMGIGQERRTWMFFPVHSPKGMTRETPELNQTEILVRLNALNDETRLKILQEISAHGPLTSSEVMEQLGLSQSAASRHLMQLSATGYLSETRVQGAKQYSINPGKIDETLHAVMALLRKK